MIITIDGPSASGKSTVAELLAETLNFVHFNSGSLYRGVTAHLIDKIGVAGIESLATNPKSCPLFDLEVRFVGKVQHVLVDKVDYTDRLRLNEVSNLTPIVSKVRYVRKKIDECQTSFGKANNIVIDGRDTGSYVFPDADVKFYLDCSLEVRAVRRFNEEKLKPKHPTLAKIKNEIKVRDEIDKNKTIAPLVVPKGAVIIDSTNLSVQEVTDVMLDHINKVKKTRKTK